MGGTTYGGGHCFLGVVAYCTGEGITFKGWKHRVWGGDTVYGGGDCFEGWCLIVKGWALLLKGKDTAHGVVGVGITA